MFVVRSGIPALDSLFHPGQPATSDHEGETSDSGIHLDDVKNSTSLCISGPDGTGKSVLAMHYTSRYLADARQLCRHEGTHEPLAFYISSDLSFDRGKGMWTRFRLHRPNQRTIPYKYPQIALEQVPPWLGSGSYKADECLKLIPYAPEEPDKLAQYLLNPSPQGVAFVDLASRTAGDDWGFMERLLATVRTPEENEPRHLLVIDAMEGMETFAGELDGFGLPTTRRGRVAKLVRLAAGKAHLIFVIEEPEEGAHMAEQFVADVVLRLRATEAQGYSRRTIEVEKARGQSHVRGRHPYVIRDGRGSTTGEQVNPDDPRIEISGKGRYQGYIDVFPSLHSISRAIMQTRGARRGERSGKRAGFGIEALDEMLAPAQERVGHDPHGQDEHGLPVGSVSALIGDANTQKSFLGLAFLGHAFHELAWNVISKSDTENAGWTDEDCTSADPPRAHYVKHLCKSPTNPADLPPELRRWAAIIERVGRGHAGAAVLVTTHDENNRTLVDRFCDQLQVETESRAKTRSPKTLPLVQKTWKDPHFKKALTAYLESRTICRRLGIHDIPPPVLFHTIRRSIEAAQQIIAFDASSAWGEPLDYRAIGRATEGWRIRFVLDDFNSIMRTYGKVHEDPLFLPFLLRSLRREGLSSLIIETQPIRHGIALLDMREEEDQSVLRTLSDYRIYTWQVPDFFGDHRIAIAAIPPMIQSREHKSRVLVRELEWYEPNSRKTPRVDRRFELYAGLDTDKPKLVPLQVHLYAETPGWKAYIERLNNLWQRVFEPPATEEGGPARSVVVAEPAENYDLLREACSLHADTNLEYSLIMQVDEFWEHGDAFRSQYEYLMRPLPQTDPSSNQDAPRRMTRARWFDDHAYGFPPPNPEQREPTTLELEAEAKEHPRLDRIPFVWDFGFLACRADVWKRATTQSSDEKARFAGELWQRMQNNEPYSWAEVFQASSYVAKWESARQGRIVPAFDLAMVAPEAFSCLVLEIWFSEIYEKEKAGKPETALADAMQCRKWEKLDEGIGLTELLTKYSDELYCTWLLLVEVLDLNAFTPREERFGFAFGRKADASAIATRQWYKNAVLMNEGEETPRMLRFCRLPGHFSVRGDWFLAAVRGSRSDSLADRALDLLSSAEANVDRLLRGLGLPARKLDIAPDRLSTRLRGWHHRPPTGQQDGGLPDANDPGTLTLQEVLSLGASDDPERAFHWLWRGNIKDYHCVAPVWERWLYRILRRWKRTKEYFAMDWISGFDLYNDEQRRKSIGSYKDFENMRDTLLAELATAVQHPTKSDTA